MTDLEKVKLAVERVYVRWQQLLPPEKSADWILREFRNELDKIHEITP